MAFNVDNLVYEKTIALEFFDKATKELSWRISDIKDPSLQTSANSTDKTDAQGQPVMKFYNAKTAQLTGSNAFFSLGLNAAQYGSKVTVATTENKIVCPYTEVITVGETSGTKNTTITLTKTPYGTAGSEVKFIYVQNTNKSIGTSYPVAATADATHFSIATKVITLPTDAEITKDTKIIVFYDYETSEAVLLANNASDIPASGVARMKSVFCDPCNKETKYALWVVSNNAQLSAESQVNFTQDGDHPFTIDFLKEYCSDDGNLFTIFVPKE